ncbi:MAG: hypothetical protein L0216_09450, partial [Planctomycetales bacterium]|nr:hypothetical protein [Planctomycetales bacterium]
LLARVDRAVLLAGGRVVAEGPPAEVGTPERISEAFGVSADFVRGGFTVHGSRFTENKAKAAEGREGESP